VATDFLNWLKLYDLAGTWADVAGLLGFAITIIAALSARRAAVAAKAAAESARSRIRMFDTVVDTQSIIASLDEIKRLHRQTIDWKTLPEKYSGARRQLIQLRAGGILFLKSDLSVIQNLISNLSDMESQVDAHLKGKTAPRGDKFNMLISADNDALVELLQALKLRGAA
jgi:hypothetical protein